MLFLASRTRSAPDDVGMGARHFSVGADIAVLHQWWRKALGD